MITCAQIEKLIADPRFQTLKYKQEKTNVFTIVGQTHTEHWHSAFFGWLFDAHSSLRLGHFPLARLLNLYMIKKTDAGITLRDLFSWNLDAVRFCTEKNASIGEKKRSIDVYGESDELIIVIENKVNARENYNHSSVGQTADYREYVETHRRPGQLPLYFFITADSKQNASSDAYVQISYQEIYDNIIEKCMEHPQVSEDGRYLLEQYASNLRETIHNSNTPMAMVNMRLCFDLYTDHAETFDGIFSEVEAAENIKESPLASCMAYDHYKSVFDEVYLSIDEYKKTPKAQLQRQIVGFDHLAKRGNAEVGMNFHMDFENETYYAKVIWNSADNTYSFQVLDEKKHPYTDVETGRVLGIFDNSLSAGVFAVNIRRKQRGISTRLKTLNGSAEWIGEDGRSLREILKICKGASEQ